MRSHPYRGKSFWWTGPTSAPFGSPAKIPSILSCESFSRVNLFPAIQSHVLHLVGGSRKKGDQEDDQDQDQKEDSYVGNVLLLLLLERHHRVCSV